LRSPSATPRPFRSSKRAWNTNAGTSRQAKGLAVVEVEAEGFDLAERTALTRESNGGKKHYPSDRSEGARISQ
jgi:hypothetical protein